MLDQANTMFLREMAKEYMTATQPDLPALTWGGQIVLISDDEGLRHSYRLAVEMIGGRWGNPLSWDFGRDDLQARVNISLIIFHISGWTDNIRQSLKQAEQFCETLGIPLLLRVDLIDLDAALAETSYTAVEHLLSDDPAELLVSIQSRLKNSPDLAYGDRDEVDLTDLKKISEDVERIARALVQLSGPNLPVGEKDLIRNPLREPLIETKVSDAPVNFKAMNGDGLQPLGSTRTADKQTQKQTGSISAKQVRDLIKARRLRDQYFDPELFADPAWDMLLDLMAARLEDVKVSVSSLCIAASVPPTTALRWIKTMTEEKIFLRKADEKDGRRIFIELSDEATAGMIGFFSMIRRNKLMIV